MSYIFESLYLDTSDLVDEVLDPQTGRPKSLKWAGAIKMMDTILFKDGFHPKKWIFTDLLGRIQFKDINSITINDVIRAFLVNLNENKKNEFNNEDLIEFLGNNKNRSKICFAISGNTRHFLDIAALSDIKNKFPKGIDALQLYKIPTRDFLPYFYYHTLQFKNNGVLQSHLIVRVSHFVQDLGNQTQRNSVFYEEKIPDEEYDYFAFQMLEVSKQLISRMQQKNPQSIVKSIKITYLIESSNYDPWFIGTEHCYLYVKKDTQNTGRQQVSRSLIQFSRQNTNRLDSVQKLSFVKKLQEDVNQSRAQIIQTSPNYQDYSKFQQDRPNEDIFALSTNEYVTQTDLLKGLQQIGEQYGKDSNVNVKIRRPKTMQVLTEEKSRRMLKYQQQIQEQRTKLKDKGRRIVELFPKYLEKSGSKPHSKFLFGNVSSERLFKDYQRLRFQKQQANETDILKTESQHNQTNTSMNNNNRSIFDIPMSDANNIERSMLTELPYQDGYYQERESTLMNDDNLTELNEQLILNKDISMFQQNNRSSLGQLGENQSVKESIISYGEDASNSMIVGGQNRTASNFGDYVRTQNDFLNRSLMESQMMDEPKLQLAGNEFEKSLISLLMMNKDLDNMVVIDKNKAINNIRYKIKQDETMRQLNSESDQIFTGQRRRLEHEEARTYYQWKQLVQDHQNTQPDMDSEFNNNSSILHPIMPFAKRSKTATGFRKPGSTIQRKKQTVLSLLQIKGKEAKVEQVSKYDMQKQLLASNKEQQYNQNKKKLEEKKDQGTENLNFQFMKSQNRSSITYQQTPKDFNITKKAKPLNLHDQSQSKAVFLRIIQGIQKVCDN